MEGVGRHFSAMVGCVGVIDRRALRREEMVCVVGCVLLIVLVTVIVVRRTRQEIELV